MSVPVQSLSIEYTADVKKALSGIETVNKAVQKSNREIDRSVGAIQTSMSRIGTSMSLGVTAPLLLMGRAAVKNAMDAVESENLFAVSMGKRASSARAWSESTSKALELNAYEVRQNIATLNVMLGSMQMGERRSYEMARGLTKLAYDMASFYNLKPEEAFEKLRSGISGEVEPLRQLGISVSETAVKTYAYTNGIAKQGAALSEQQKILARYGVIMQSTSKAQGDMARTLDSPTNKLRALSAQIKEGSIKLASDWLPMVSKAIGKAKDATVSFNNMSEGQRHFVSGTALIAAAAGPMLIGLSSMITALKTVRGAYIAAAAAAIRFRNESIAAAGVDKFTAGGALRTIGKGILGSPIGQIGTATALLYGTKLAADYVNDKTFADVAKSQKQNADVAKRSRSNMQEILSGKSKLSKSNQLRALQAYRELDIFSTTYGGGAASTVRYLKSKGNLSKSEKQQINEYNKINDAIAKIQKGKYKPVVSPSNMKSSGDIKSLLSMGSLGSPVSANGKSGSGGGSARKSLVNTTSESKTNSKLQQDIAKINKQALERASRTTDEYYKRHIQLDAQEAIEIKKLEYSVKNKTQLTQGLAKIKQKHTDAVKALQDERWTKQTEAQMDKDLIKSAEEDRKYLIKMRMLSDSYNAGKMAEAEMNSILAEAGGNPLLAAQWRNYLSFKNEEATIAQRGRQGYDVSKEMQLAKLKYQMADRQSTIDVSKNIWERIQSYRQEANEKRKSIAEQMESERQRQRNLLQWTDAESVRKETMLESVRRQYGKSRYNYTPVDMYAPISPNEMNRLDEDMYTETQRQSFLLEQIVAYLNPPASAYSN